MSNDREEAIDILTRMSTNHFYGHREQEAFKLGAEALSAERHGRWEFNIDDEGWSWDYPYMCDQCGEWVEKVFKFCPSCGAKMNEVEE